MGDSLAETDERKDLIRSLWDRTLQSTEPVTWHGVEDNVQTYSSSTKVVAATKLLMGLDPEKLSSKPIGLLLINYSTDYLYDYFSEAGTDKGRLHAGGGPPAAPDLPPRQAQDRNAHHRGLRAAAERAFRHLHPADPATRMCC